VQILTRAGSPITFTRQGGTLQNDAERRQAMTAGNAGTQSGTVEVNAPCNTEVYVTLAAAGGGATLQNVNVTVEPLVNCMLPVADAGAGGGGGGGDDAGTGGGSGGTTTIPAVGENNTTSQTPAPVGCGCSAGALPGTGLALLALVARRRRQGR
jgi:hypothetical protein